MQKDLGQVRVNGLDYVIDFSWPWGLIVLKMVLEWRSGAGWMAMRAKILIH